MWDRHTNWLPSSCTWPSTSGIEPTTQVCDLDQNQTHDPSVHGLTFYPLAKPAIAKPSWFLKDQTFNINIHSSHILILLCFRELTLILLTKGIPVKNSDRHIISTQNYFSLSYIYSYAINTFFDLLYLKEMYDLYRIYHLAQLGLFTCLFH